MELSNIKGEWIIPAKKSYLNSTKYIKVLVLTAQLIHYVLWKFQHSLKANKYFITMPHSYYIAIGIIYFSQFYVNIKSNWTKKQGVKSDK